MIAPGEAGRQDSASGSWVRLRRKPKSFVKLILLGFALVGLPLIVALINSAFSIDRLANQSRKAVYQAAEIAHSSRALADEIANMERAVRQTHILGDTALLEGYFRGHAGFEKIAAGLAVPQLHRSRDTWRPLELLGHAGGLSNHVEQYLGLGPLEVRPREVLFVLFISRVRRRRGLVDA